MNSIEQLNQQFAIEHHVNFKHGKGNLPLIVVSGKHASASISLHGGQVLSYKKTSSPHDLLFVSDKAWFEAGKAIKGGAPVCWPWFAAHPDDNTLPFHGLVRNQLWHVESTECRDNGELVITLFYNNNAHTQQYWPYSFELKEVITIGEQLEIMLITTNTGPGVFTITQAIHTYFNVGDISRLEVTGLENKTYLDKVEHFCEKHQDGPITVNQEIDRIYQHVDTPIIIEDPAWQRRIHINHQGSRTSVVWNPWKDISHRSADLEDNAYKHFVCVETANAAQDKITIEPGNSHKLVARYDLTEYVK